MRAWRVVTLALALAACGDDGGEDPTDAGHWDAGTGAIDGGSILSFEPCLAERLECATVSVPLEYDDPSLGMIGLRVVRLPASGEAAGTVVLIPGGPGDSGARLMVAQASDLRSVLGVYDIVSFDVRGVEASAGVRCVTDEEWEAISALDFSPDDEVERAALAEARATFHAGCTMRMEPELLRRVDTGRSAMDLDRVRAALGADRIHVLAFSYGAWLAVRYAEHHPERLGAVLLDSPPVASIDGRELLRVQAAGYETALGDFFTTVGADAASPFHGGEGSMAVAAAFDALVIALDATGDRELAERAVLAGLSAGTPGVLSDALRQAEDGSATGLSELARSPLTRRADGTRSTYAESFLAIYSLDRPLPTGFDDAAFEALVDELRVEAPRLAAAVAARYRLLVEWPVRPAGDPVPLGAVDAPPMLLVAGRADPVAPLEHVEALQTQLGNGSHLLIRNGSGHLQLGRGFCVLDVALRYMDDPSAPLFAAECD